MAPSIPKPAEASPVSLVDAIAAANTVEELTAVLKQTASWDYVCRALARPPAASVLPAKMEELKAGHVLAEARLSRVGLYGSRQYSC